MKGVKNRGWIAVFVLIGVILAISVGSLVYSAKNQSISAISGYAISEDRTADNIKFERYLCTKKLAIEGLDLYGLNESSVSEYVSKKLGDCINPVIQKYMKGYTMDSKFESLNIDIGEMDIKINANFPVLLNGNGEVEKIGNFSIILRRYTSKELNHDENCIISEDSWLSSFDNKFEIFIPSGVEARNPDGTCLENISLKLETPIINLQKNSLGLTSIEYSPGPNGANFRDGAILRWIDANNNYTEYIANSIGSENYPPRI